MPVIRLEHQPAAESARKRFRDYARAMCSGVGKIAPMVRHLGDGKHKATSNGGRPVSELRRQWSTATIKVASVRLPERAYENRTEYFFNPAQRSFKGGL